MRVRISYGMDIKDVPFKVAELLETAAAETRKLSKSLMQISNDLNDDNEEDAKFKKDLGDLYKVVDEEVDEVFGDTSVGQKAGAIYDYAKYAIIDPINLLGGVAGKAIGATAGRAAIKGL